ncbi:MAG: sulfatase [Candidatus Poribacteria bacterium]|nr:sulfatase [Candidatus Poribacteria bacterium]
MNLIFIVSDTFRRDHLGCYGNSWIRTPYLDKFAKISTVFDAAYLCSFPTVPTRFEFLTGNVAFPTRGWQPMPLDQTTLAERFRGAGYISMGIFDTSNLMRQGYNYMKGFNAFEWIRGQEGDEHSIDLMEVELGTPPEQLRNGWQHNLYQHRRSTRFRLYERDYFVAQTMQTACDWLERNYEWDKFFLYVDTFDPHEPWEAPEWYLRLYEKEEWTGNRLDYPKGGPVEGVYTDEEIQHIRALYAAEVTLVDKWVGRLLEKIEDLGLLENSIVVFASDHGTQHGEHGLMMKGFGMYEETARVPLMIYHPTVKPGRIDSLVQLPDVPATLLDAAGSPGLEEIDGQSLLPLMRGEADTIRSITCSSPQLRAGGGHGSMSVTDGTWSLVFYSDDKPGELYYLPDDPKQANNRIGDEPEIAHRLFDGFIEFTRQYRGSDEVLAPLTLA